MRSFNAAWQHTAANTCYFQHYSDCCRLMKRLPFANDTPNFSLLVHISNIEISTTTEEGLFTNNYVSPSSNLLCENFTTFLLHKCCNLVDIPVPGIESLSHSVNLISIKNSGLDPSDIHGLVNLIN